MVMFIFLYIYMCEMSFEFSFDISLICDLFLATLGENILADISSWHTFSRFLGWLSKFTSYFSVTSFTGMLDAFFEFIKFQNMNSASN